MQLGNKILEYRKKQGITQEELAKEMGVSIGAVSKWENNNSLPDILMLCALADFFGVSTDELLGRGKKPGFLVADDEEFICDTMEQLLNNKNCACYKKISDGEQLLLAVKEYEPEGVFCDIHMPNKDGLAALREIKRAYSEMKVIVLTADLSEETKKKAMEYGADAYITKPFKPEAIEAVLQDLF